MRRCFVFILLFILALSAQAAHITDKLVIGLHEKPSLEGEPVQLLASGTPVEVLEKQGDVLKVRLADDTQGWVEAGYVTEEKPASMMLLEAQAELHQLKQNGDTIDSESAQLKLELEAARERISRLEKGQADLLAARMAQGKLEELRGRVQQAVDILGAEPSGLLNQQHGSVVERFLPWIASLVMLIIGFVAGAAYIDYRVRKRFGGIRI